ncbi:FAD-dependent oxidoreductase [Clostridium perfringens]|uniref:Iron-sulfur cluster-binding protein, rieske family n=3 Tax=Clostridium perfringens TaxID=1502 RepID=A0A0H2YRX9_CLOP1|nr:FAD-dependent oxidoreductase [Clostridium perfringens]ABG83188.1 iron-sulfur cluster-binding protein, rieske family [Clostridium perfringens ATCC 13124]AMN32241.1 FAD-dependent oxidoreductase [Clostridium perfringens]AOY53173.1 iron-sulfur cluster-binding protein, rieske family [Clostridium perfringens]EHK2279876.1 FAD-dependent oxidoreductase [Clostridium perfringens]EIF6173847.1 FAD-dependent oxidoreductase [Clostridium perfringens]
MKSVWSESCKFRKREALNKDIKTDVLVIGAGIAGVLTAYMLKQKGRDVVLIDAAEIASGNTKNTTAKITSQHDLIYSKLIAEFGEEKARQYAKANELAIKKYKEIIEDKRIECDFEEKPAYVYSLNEVDVLKEEVEAAKNLGIDAEFVQEANLPFKINGAVKFNNQAQFNPLKFLKGISNELVIYENTRALEIKENLVVTSGGNITANNIVVATHYPIMNAPGYYFMKMHQERSYVLALENTSEIDGMYIDLNKEGYSFRTYNNLLLLGGISHRTGENEEGGSYDELRKVAKRLYPKAKEKYYWSAQDCMTIDGIPYIGRYSSETPNIYVATGFNKWGMTSSMVSAMIISDMILEKENDFSEIFSPRRFDLSLSINNIANDLIETAKNFIAQKVYIPSSEIEHIKNGHGGIIEYNGEKVGVYKNKEGKEFFVSTKCTHLGCQLSWNSDELTWDCPCHGSRFDYKGRLIGSPATKDLVED